MTDTNRTWTPHEVTIWVLEKLAAAYQGESSASYELLPFNTLGSDAEPPGSTILKACQALQGKTESGLLTSECIGKDPRNCFIVPKATGAKQQAELPGHWFRISQAGLKLLDELRSGERRVQ